MPCKFIPDKPGLAVHHLSFIIHLVSKIGFVFVQKLDKKGHREPFPFTGALPPVAFLFEKTFTIQIGRAAFTATLLPVLFLANLILLHASRSRSPVGKQVA
jgi:hypothetical protein